MRIKQQTALAHLIMTLIMLFYCFAIHADQKQQVTFTQRADVEEFITNLVKHYHFKRAQLIAVLSQSHFQKRIIEAMTRPYESKPWGAYRKLFVTQSKIEGGVRFWTQHEKALLKAEAEYGVPAQMIVAILGIETRYGQRQGKYHVLDALSTLAFYYPKRSQFFRKELREYLLLSKEQHFKATQVLGSYAGAMGEPQFMPSSYRHYAVNYDHKGKIDLLHNDNDAIASIANYLRKNGWQPGEIVAAPAHVTGSSYHKILQKNLYHPTTNISEFIHYEVKTLGQFPIQQKASLIELDGEKPEYWLGFTNFYVITRYNHSILYAMAAYQLSEEIKKKYDAQHKKTHIVTALA